MLFLLLALIRRQIWLMRCAAGVAASGKSCSHNFVEMPNFPVAFRAGSRRRWEIHSNTDAEKRGEADWRSQFWCTTSRACVRVGVDQIEKKKFRIRLPRCENTRKLKMLQPGTAIIPMRGIMDILGALREKKNNSWTDAAHKLGRAEGSRN